MLSVHVFGDAEIEFARAAKNLAPAVRAAVQRSIVGSAGPGDQVQEMMMAITACTTLAVL